MSYGKKMCKHKIATSFWGEFCGQTNNLRCQNPNIPANTVREMDPKHCCRRLCPYYESR